MLAAAGLVAIGAFLPWIKATAVLVGTITKSGTEGGDGWIAIALVVPLAIFGTRRLTATRARIPGAVALIFSLILGGLTVYEISDVSRRASNVNDSANGYAHAEIGVGLWMLAIGTALAVIGSIVALNQPKTVVPGGSDGVTPSPRSGGGPFWQDIKQITLGQAETKAE